MKTQSIDTHPDAERVMIEMIRKAPMSKRFRLVQSLTQSALWANFHAWQENHPKASEDEAVVQFAICFYGTALARQMQIALATHVPWHMYPAQLMAAVHPILSAFDELHVPYYLGGSIASSLHGMQHMAQDIDLIVDLPEQSLPSLLPLFQQHYVFDGNMAFQTAREQASFSLVHLNSLMKIDLVFTNMDEFNVSMRQLITRHILDEQRSPLPIASAYEMILFKLQRYQEKERSHANGMHDDAEWNDILGMLKVQGTALNLTFLERWSKKLCILDALRKALIDADLSS